MKDQGLSTIDYYDIEGRVTFDTYELFEFIKNNSIRGESKDEIKEKLTSYVAKQLVSVLTYIDQAPMVCTCSLCKADYETDSNELLVCLDCKNKICGSENIKERKTGVY